jgi:hypothetical protein
MERWIQRYRASRGDRRITIRVTPETYHYMMKGRFSRRLHLMWKFWMKIQFVKDESLDIREFKVFDRKNEQVIEMK